MKSHSDPRPLSQGINQTPRVVAALRLGEFTAADLAKMLWLQPWSVTRVLLRLKRLGRVRVVRSQGEGVRVTKRVWALRA